MNKLKQKLFSLWFNLNTWYAYKTAYKRYYISFTQEMIMDPQFNDYIAGRLEICNNMLSPYSIEEQRVFTRDIEDFYKDLDKVEWKDSTLKKLNKRLKNFDKYYEKYYFKETE